MSNRRTFNIKAASLDALAIPGRGCVWCIALYVYIFWYGWMCRFFNSPQADDASLVMKSILDQMNEHVLLFFGSMTLLYVPLFVVSLLATKYGPVPR
jgi:hypothetical protein